MALPMRRHLPLVLLLIMARSSILPASDKATREGKDLVEQAEIRANIFELPSFQMKASVRVENKGKPVDGSYILSGMSPTNGGRRSFCPGTAKLRSVARASSPSRGARTSSPCRSTSYTE